MKFAVNLTEKYTKWQKDNVKGSKSATTIVKDRKTIFYLRNEILITCN